MEAIRIRRCRLRVIRHGGWSWGPDPRQFVDQVTQRLPAWLMQALAEQLADCPPESAIAHLRLRIPVKLSELRDWPSQYPEHGGQATLGLLSQRVQALLAAALADLPRSRPEPAAEPAPAKTQQEADEAPSPTPVLDLWIAWQRAGDLPRVFATADAATLGVWARVLLQELAAAGGTGALAVAGSMPRVRRIESMLRNPDAAIDPLLGELAGLVAALAAPAPGTVADPAFAANDPAAPASLHEEPVQADGAPAHAVSRAKHPPGIRSRAPPERQRRRTPVAVESVLPFIVAGILSRRKYFEGLRAALVCSDLLDQSACFAAALAYKLAPPPRRGWERGSATRQLAAAMCGLDEPPDNTRMDSFLRGLSTTCAPLDASLWAGNRASGRQPGILVEKLQEAPWAALDIATAQPLGWFAQAGDVLRLADLLPGRLWWLAPGAADSELPEALRHRGLRAVALGAPLRGAGWLRAGDALWTSEPLLRRHGAQLQRVFDDAREVLAATHEAFMDLRPLVLPARGPHRHAAEFSIALAVCSALGELADALWREREPTQPLLALRRFADLGGTVAVEDGRVLVRPALGLRFMDLGNHGFLRDIVGIPWWPGRRVEFAGP
ncbi:hypothetical protein H4CHR_00499 [Variovorax sp. PBS-H4]|uniref:hypothetical protein n=1 Tax=Variovorax sp. PBS-H4 TaxID=434008 RepID=UPI001317E305|nr:hypothetical protein [Variovorax sp. PBS-H4]VTU20009.1 hypothetical protein H4CHR_00499 [Variovorax sp. PBS-H4]